MSADVRRRTVRLTAAAENDFRDIVRWTLTEFGSRQARVYAATLSAALRDLTAGPSTPGARQRDEIAKGVFSLHVAWKGRKGRHFVIFRIVRDQDTNMIDVLRLLHDAMGLPRHLPPSDVND